jgi:hypothetical protein
MHGNCSALFLMQQAEKGMKLHAILAQHTRNTDALGGPRRYSGSSSGFFYFTLSPVSLGVHSLMRTSYPKGHASEAQQPLVTQAVSVVHEHDWCECCLVGITGAHAHARVCTVQSPMQEI